MRRDAVVVATIVRRDAIEAALALISDGRREQGFAVLLDGFARQARILGVHS